jgi:hypothetical protein
VRSRLTAAGRRKIEAKRALWRRRWEQELAGVSSADLRVAADVLARLSAVFANQADAEARAQLDASSGPRENLAQASRKSQ